MIKIPTCKWACIIGLKQFRFQTTLKAYPLHLNTRSYRTHVQKDGLIRIILFKSNQRFEI